MLLKSKLFIISVLFLVFSTESVAVVIGGWGSSFGPGSGSFANGSNYSTARNALVSEFSGESFSFSGLNDLTSSSLAGVDILFLNSATGGGGWFPSTINRRLTGTEKSDLRQFVEDGGSVIINAYGAYMTGSPAVHEINGDLLSPFGLSVSGGGSVSPHNYNVTNPSNDLITSSNYTINSFSLPWDGYFNNLGAATGVGTSGGWGSGVLAYFSPGDLAAGSGAAVFVSSSLWAMNSYIGTSDNQELLLNSFKFAMDSNQGGSAPSPGTLLLLFSLLPYAIITKRKTARVLATN